MCDQRRQPTQPQVLQWLYGGSVTEQRYNCAYIPYQHFLVSDYIMMPVPEVHAELHPDWKAYLEQMGAVVAHGEVLHFGKPEAEQSSVAHGNWIADLSHLSIVQASGPDAESFLQSQFSNDIRLVTEQQAQLSAYCNPKGRMYAIFLVVKRGNDFLLQLPASLAGPTLQRLRMFILRSKLTLDKTQPALVSAGIAGPDSEALVRTITSTVPTESFGVATNQGVTAIRLPGPNPRFEILAPMDQMKLVWSEAVTRNYVRCGKTSWSWANIMSGLPTVLPGTVEEFVPQMANLELVQGVSFNKGCYPGQEIVARMHYLGRLKQRMVIAHIPSPDCPAPGTPVFAPEFPDQSAGTIVDAQPSPQNGCDALVVAQIQCIRNNTVHLDSANGTALDITLPPYSFPLE